MKRAGIGQETRVDILGHLPGQGSPQNLYQVQDDLGGGTRPGIDQVQIPEEAIAHVVIDVDDFADFFHFVELFPQPDPVSAVQGKGHVEPALRRGLMNDLLGPRKKGKDFRNRVLGQDSHFLSQAFQSQTQRQDGANGVSFRVLVGGD